LKLLLLYHLAFERVFEFWFVVVVHEVVNVVSIGGFVPFHHVDNDQEQVEGSAEKIGDLLLNV
jgi:hypothetical protein